MTTFRAVSAEQLGLSREIRALATETDGLVLVSGPRVSGKSTLIAAFVDLINRSRRVYLVTLEREIRVVHESRASFVSQREARTDGEMLEAMRHALYEEPDVIFVEELRGAEMLALALDGAASGRLVVATLPAPTSAAAIEYLVNFVRPEERREVLHGIAESLRGIVAQVLVRKPGGGHVAARELMLNSTAIAALIAEGRLSELTAAIGNEHKLGMVPLNDALAGFVKSGHVDIREAYRRAADRGDFLAVLQRQGVDTSFAERPA
jgi:twitching motility protein PilT